jgi:hypothetical protein
MLAMLETAGERVAVTVAPLWVAELIAEGAAGELRAWDGGESVRIRVEDGRAPFDTGGWELLCRGAWRRDGAVVIENACTSGFDVHAAYADEVAELTFRWRPPARDRAAARVLRSRFHLLARAVLLQFPALWRAGIRGRAPLHASGCVAEGCAPLVTAASGVGRSTLITRELGNGGRSTGDNLAVGDGICVWGLVEPLRIENGDGRRMPHGRKESAMPGREPAVAPDCVVVLERGGPGARPVEPRGALAAARCLTAATFMAGELRRYWAFAATLAAGTGVGPVQPPVGEVALAFAERLPCLVLRRPDLSALAEYWPGGPGSVAGVRPEGETRGRVTPSVEVVR